MGGGVERYNYKNNGFTLAELLAVIAILAIIALIVFPVVNKAIKNSKEKSYNQQVESILSSAENWTLENMTSLSDTNDNYVTISELQQSGYLEVKKVINPKTDEEMNGCIVIRYDNAYNQYTYRYEEESCSDIQVVPIIMLNGDTTITIGKGETFTDPGYSATYKETDITSNVVVTGTVNTSTVGTYTLEYSVNYNGKSAKKYRTVNVELLYQTFREVMEPLLGTDVNNNDPDGNLRYVGADPDNYVWFNEELWRVIGLFDGQPKIIRTSEYGSGVWGGGTANPGDEDAHLNDWERAVVKDEFITFLESIQTDNPISYSYIDLNHVWNIGGTANYQTSTRSDFYYAERSETISPKMTNHLWTGAIGLIYPSDYAYATNGDESTCDSTAIWNWGTECFEKSWLRGSEWTMTADTGSVCYIYAIAATVYPNGYDSSGYMYPFRFSYPVLFLNSNVKITGGQGTEDDPYVLGIE